MSGNLTAMFVNLVYYIYNLLINLINMQAMILYGDQTSISLFIISLILFLIISYETFIFYTINKPFKATLQFSIKNLKELALKYSLLLLTSFLLLVTITLIYIFTYVKTNIIIPSIIAITLILILNMQRLNLMQKIHSLK